MTSQEITEIAQQSIESKSTEFLNLEAFTLKLSNQRLEKGDTLKVGVYSDSAISSFSNVVNNYESPDGAGLQYLDVKLEKHLKSTFRISEQTSRANLEQYISAGIDAILDGLETFLFSLISAANFPGQITISNFDQSKIADIWANEKVSIMNESKKMVIKNAFYSSLFGELSHYQKSNTDQTLRAAKVGKINGFEIMNSSNLPIGLNGFITDCTGIAAALAVPAIQDTATTQNIFATRVTSQNGVSMQLRKHTNPKNGSLFGTVELLAGSRVLDNLGLIRIV